MPNNRDPEGQDFQSLVFLVENLRESHVRAVVDSRINEFRRLGEGSSRDLFKEMSFCILTANYSAEKSMRMQSAIGEGFITLTEEALANRLREMGHRYPEARASYIVQGRGHADSLKDELASLPSPADARKWLADSIKGLGYKESSHFLRNIGYLDLAILDFHILDVLERHRCITKPKALTRKRYVEVESVLRELSERIGLALGELDLYLWYSETGKVLK